MPGAATGPPSGPTSPTEAELLGARVRPEILASWQRSAHYLGAARRQVPATDSDLARGLCQASPLSRATQRQQRKIQQVTRDAGLFAAVADPCGRLLWTCTSSRMRKSSQTIDLSSNTCVNEGSAGTNAAGLALQLRRPITVFSAEHFEPFFHDWVCYAAPVLDPRTGACIGILSLGTTWDRRVPGFRKARGHKPGSSRARLKPPPRQAAGHALNAAWRQEGLG